MLPTLTPAVHGFKLGLIGQEGLHPMIFFGYPFLRSESLHLLRPNTGAFQVLYDETVGHRQYIYCMDDTAVCFRIVQRVPHAYHIRCSTLVTKARSMAVYTFVSPIPSGTALRDHPSLQRYIARGDSILLYNGGPVRKGQIVLAYLACQRDGTPLYAACRAVEDTRVPPIVTITEHGPEVNVGPWIQLDWAPHVFDYAYLPKAVTPIGQTISVVGWLEQEERTTCPKSIHVVLHNSAASVSRGNKKARYGGVCTRLC